MWWMETFGLAISSVTLVIGFLYIFAAVAVLRIYRSIINYKLEVRKKESRLRNLKGKIEKDYFDTNTLDETVSCQDHKITYN